MAEFVAYWSSAGGGMFLAEEELNVSGGQKVNYSTSVG